MKKPRTTPKDWRDYQRQLKRISRRKNIQEKLPVLVLYGVLFFLVLVGTFFSGSWLYAHLTVKKPVPSEIILSGEAEKEVLSREKLPDLLGSVNLLSGINEKEFVFEADNRGFTAETTINTELQAYIEKLLGRSLTHRAAVIVMSPMDGRIHAMASYAGQESGVTENLCLRADFPAASLFKIVAAAAAIEARGFSPERNLKYRGRRYTLYKSQLKKVESGRYTNEISFKRAFSTSINPVFGKIGIYYLGQELLQKYAEKFLYNAPIPLELPLGLSSIDVPSDDFGLAEIASGFNKRTLISPVHASLITASIANDGVMMAPWLIRRIRDENGEVIYRAQMEVLAHPIDEETALGMRTLMQDTVRHGTCRSTFRKILRKKKFKGIEIGAKTGTINDRQDKYKFDWLTAYALPTDKRSSVCLAVLAVHGKKLGIRAKDLAMHILDHHY
jgi:cell division protein FtsI/penicillin-binding protein 2